MASEPGHRPVTPAGRSGTAPPVVVVGSTLLPPIRNQLQFDLDDCVVVAADLGNRDYEPDLTKLQATLAAADAIVPVRGLVNRRVLGLAKRCRIIQQFGAGVDMVDLEAARQFGVPVCNVPSRFGGNADSVAELALFHLIASGRSFKLLQHLVASGDFGAPFGRSLHGKTVCIVGFGNIGSKLARLLRPFSCDVIGLRRMVPDTTRFPAHVRVWPMDRLGDALAVSDFVVVTVPLSRETVGIIGADAFSRMKPGAVLVNTSRGPTVDRSALLDALRSGQISAAGLDVFWEEPVPPSDPILEQNVIATPHCAGLTDHMLAGTSRIVADNIRRAILGKKPRYRIVR